MNKITRVLASLVLGFAALVSCQPKEEGGNGGTTPAAAQVHVEATSFEASLKNIAAGKNIYYTAFGTADYAYGLQLVQEAGATVTTADKYLELTNVAAGSIVVAMTGFTSKGLATGVTQQSETNRAAAFAASENITLIVMHIGGAARRGSSSDPIIEAACKGAVCTIIGYYSAGDSDNKIESWCKSGSHVYKYDDETACNDLLAWMLVGE